MELVDPPLLTLATPQPWRRVEQGQRHLLHSPEAMPAAAGAQHLLPSPEAMPAAAEVLQWERNPGCCHLALEPLWVAILAERALSVAVAWEEPDCCHLALEQSWVAILAEQALSAAVA